MVPVSAKAGKGIGMLRDMVLALLPEGPALYPEETVSDQPFEVKLAEMIREKALHVTRQELPHSITVTLDEIETSEGLTKIYASLIVERDSQKGIVIGKGGQTLRTIGSRAREEMELVLGTKVFLDLQGEGREGVAEGSEGAGAARVLISRDGEGGLHLRVERARHGVAAGSRPVRLGLARGSSVHVDVHIGSHHGEGMRRVARVLGA